LEGWTLDVGGFGGWQVDSWRLEIGGWQVASWRLENGWRRTGEFGERIGGRIGGLVRLLEVAGCWRLQVVGG